MDNFFGATIPPKGLIMRGLIGFTYRFGIKCIKTIHKKFGKLTTYPYTPPSCVDIPYQNTILKQAYHNIGFWGIVFPYPFDSVVNPITYQKGIRS